MKGASAMPVLLLTIKLDDAAITDDPTTELPRIFHQIAASLAACPPGPGFYQSIHDANGNKIGHICSLDAAK